jgi:putative peptidoglycan lipid II flippase
MIVLSSLIMAAALYGAAIMLEPWLAGRGSLLRFGALAALVGIGCAVYFTVAQITGAARLMQLAAAFRRK